MLVVCNGAIKSGSTWLYNILVHLRELHRPPDRYLTPSSRERTTNPCIRPDMLREFLENEDVEGCDFISKNHVWRPEHREVLLGNHRVYVFDIERGIRDVVVSAYHDARNRQGFEGSFSRYYWRSGRYLADHVIRYHQAWRNAGPRVCVISYEKLHQDFATEVRRIAGTLGQSLDDAQLAELKANTSLRQLRKHYEDQPLYQGERFFRKGIVGDWKAHFDQQALGDIERIERQGIGPLDWRRLLRTVEDAVRRRARRRLDASRATE